MFLNIKLFLKYLTLYNNTQESRAEQDWPPGQAGDGSTTGVTESLSGALSDGSCCTGQHNQEQQDTSREINHNQFLGILVQDNKVEIYC